MRSRNLLVVFIIVLFGVIGALYVVGRSAQKTAAGLKTFVFARGADAQKLDPADVDDGESIKALNNVCEGLVRFKSGTTRVEPCLAESWSISADGCLALFAIRANVKFHDGTPLTAETAAWSFRRQLDPKAPGHFAGASFAYWSALYSDIEEVRALDPGRLQFRLKKPNAALLANLAIFPAYLISPKSLADYGEGLQRHPVGTGPFKFKEWLPNDRIVLEANPEYWGKKPKLGRVVFKVVPDSASRLVQIQSAQSGVHAMDGLDPNSLPIVSSDPHLRVEQAPGLNLAYLAFNCRKGPMTNVMFRRAVAMAIQKPALIEAVYRGAAVEARSVLPPMIADNIAAAAAQAARRPSDAPPAAQAEELPFDVEQARSLIAQMRIVIRPVKVTTTDVFGLPITIETNIVEHVELPPLKLHVMTNPRPYLPNPVRAAELIKADLEAIGLKIEIAANEWGTHLAAVRNAQHDLALHGWIGDNGDPDNFLSIIDPQAAQPGAAINISFNEDADLAEALRAARSELDAGKRARTYARVLALARERLPLVPLAHAMDIVVLRQNVRGFVLQPTLDVRLGPVSLK
ncbi:MAG: ABC transporter substrate-binding protein [Verrucomicrobia bacterium]|nr:ABC transporter substrate-binding protein [Verrucomicrobiota bacterium]